MDLHVRAFISPSNRNALDRSIYFIGWHKKLNLFFSLTFRFFIRHADCGVCVCVCTAIKFLRSFWNVFSPRFSIWSQIHPAATATLAIPLFLFSQVNGTVFFAAVVVVAMNHMQKQKIETAVYFLKIFIIRCASGDGGWRKSEPVCQQTLRV